MTQRWQRQCAKAASLRPDAARVKITDLLLEVDQWTDFTRQFTHLTSEADVPGRTLLLTDTLAAAFNLGLDKMVDTCAGTNAAKPAGLVA